MCPATWNAHATATASGPGDPRVVLYLQQMLGDSANSTRIIVTTFRRWVGPLRRTRTAQTTSSRRLPDVAALTVADVLAAEGRRRVQRPHRNSRRLPRSPAMNDGDAPPSSAVEGATAASPMELPVRRRRRWRSPSALITTRACAVSLATRSTSADASTSSRACASADVALYDRLAGGVMIDDVLRDDQTARLRRSAAADEVLVRARRRARSRQERALTMRRQELEAPKAMIVVRSRRHAALCGDSSSHCRRPTTTGRQSPCSSPSPGPRRRRDGAIAQRQPWRRGGRLPPRGLRGRHRLRQARDARRAADRCMVIDRTLRGAHGFSAGRPTAAPHNQRCVLDYANEAADIGLAFRGFVDASTAPSPSTSCRPSRKADGPHLELLLERIGDRSIAAVCAASAAPTLPTPSPRTCRRTRATARRSAPRRPASHAFCQRLRRVSRDHQPTAGRSVASTRSGRGGARAWMTPAAPSTSRRPLPAALRCGR